MNRNKAILYVLVFTIYQLLLAHNSCFASPTHKIKGIYEAVWYEDIEKISAIKEEYISGITLWIPWNVIERNEGEYDWSMVDKAILIAKTHNKIVNIGIFPNFRAPNYILNDANVKKFTFHRWIHEGVKKTAKPIEVTPLPWDERYLTRWLALISELAKKYDNNKNIGYVALTGPNLQAIEMSIHLKNEEDIKLMKSYENLEDRMFAAWKKVIDGYDNSFKHVKVALTLGQLIGDNNLPKRVVSYLNTAIPTQRIILKVAFLNGKWYQKMKSNNINRQLIDMMKSYSNINQIGMEMFWISKVQDGNVNGPLSVAIQNGINDNADFIEIYNQDIENAPEDIVNDLKNGSLKLKKKK